MSFFSIYSAVLMVAHFRIECAEGLLEGLAAAGGGAPSDTTSEPLKRSRGAECSRGGIMTQPLF